MFELHGEVPPDGDLVLVSHDPVSVALVMGQFIMHAKKKKKRARTCSYCTEGAETTPLDCERTLLINSMESGI